MPRSALPAALALLTACALSACGSSGPSAEDEAGKAAVRALQAKSAKQFCQRLASERLIEEFVAGDSGSCVEASSVVSENPGKASVSEVALHDDDSQATVAVRIEGGETDGVSGHVEVTREGGRWLLDRYGDDFVRSSLLVGIREVDEGALSNQRMKACMGGQIEKLDDNRIREIHRAGISGGEVLIRALLPFAENCPRALAEYGADEFTDGLAGRGNGTAYVACLHDELEKLLLITDIAPDLIGGSPDPAAVAALEGIAAGAKRNCTGKR